MSNIDHHFEAPPEFRAFYSSNPEFTDGAYTSHPIDSPEKSLLLKPEVALALDDTYALSQGDRVTASETAMVGLQWLQKNTSDAPELRRLVVQTQRHTKAVRRDMDAQVLNAQYSQELVEQAAERAEAIAKSTSDHERLDKEQQLVDHARRGSFQDFLDDVSMDQPDADTEHLKRMVEQLEFKIVDGETKLHDAVVKQKLLKYYFENPARFRQDVKTLYGADDSHAVIRNGMLNWLNNIAFEPSLPTKMTDDQIRDWIASITINPESVSVAQMSQTSLVDCTPNTVNTQISFISMNVLTSLLKKTIHQAPDDYLKTAYQLLEIGFSIKGKKQYIAEAVASSINAACIDNAALARNILYLSIIDTNTKKRRKALDLRQVLLSAYPDPYMQSLLSLRQISLDGPLLSRSDLETMARMFKNIAKGSLQHGASEFSVTMDETYEKNVAEFSEWAHTTDEGMTSTICGRLAEDCRSIITKQGPFKNNQ